MKIISQNDEALQYLKRGQVIAYPTEAVYGLGCDPFNEQAVEKLLALKHRMMAQGFIVLIADWPQLFPLIGKLPDVLLDKVRESWPGPVTWVFPKSALIPHWLSGQHESIAIRMSAHPVARRLCLNGPVVSTSANTSGRIPAIDLAALRLQFPHGIDAVIVGELGDEKQSTGIYDVLTGARLR